MRTPLAALMGTFLGLAIACSPAPEAAPAPAPTTAPVAPKPATSPVPAPSPKPSPGAAVAASPAASPSPVACEFVLGMAAARSRFGASIVGNCLENERPIPGNGNIEQRTSNGMLVMRAIDNRFLFISTDQTLVDRDGNGTIVRRPNNQRLEWEGDRQLMESLQKGGYVVYFRHGPTDPNQTDSDPSNLANCATQRSLTDAGRQQARTIGQAIKGLQIPVGQVLSSPYCRAREYAQLLFDRPPQVEPSLVLPDPLPPAQQLQNTAALKAVLAAAKPGASNIFLVGHSPNMRQAADTDLPVEGGAAILRVQNGTPEIVARLLPTEWTDLATALTSS